MPTIPISTSGRYLQVGALPVRRVGDGPFSVLLVTSRETRRWVIPKGWPIKGLKDHEAAAQEALEEAGVVGRIAKKPLGSFSYWKRRFAQFDLCEVTVYLLRVERQLKNWREKKQRTLCWFSLEEAAALVEEPGLRQLIEDLGRPKAKT